MDRRIIVAGLSCLLLASCIKQDASKEAAGKQGAAPPSGDATPTSTPETPAIPIDVMPKLLESPVVYPEEARQRREEGKVLVKALIGKDGRVSAASVDPEGTASDLLGAAAVEAVRQWKFEPARSKGEPVEVWIVVPVNYRLR